MLLQYYFPKDIIGPAKRVSVQKSRGCGEWAGRARVELNLRGWRSVDGAVSLRVEAFGWIGNWPVEDPRRYNRVAMRWTSHESECTRRNAMFLN